MRKKLQDDLSLETELNPKLIIEQCTCKKTDGRFIKLNVIRDDNLVGGTKQRALYKYLEKYPHISEFVYAGASTSYTQVALAVCCARLKKKSTLYIQHPAPSKPPTLTALAKKLGASSQVFYDQLAEIQTRAFDYVDLKNKDKEVHEAMLIPLNLDTEEFGEILTNQILRALPPNIKKPERLWFTAHTGTLLKSISHVWPETNFMPVTVSQKLREHDFGPDLWNRMGGSERVEMLVAPQKFIQPVPQTAVPPYPSVMTHDAKVWQFIMKYGDDGDYVFNSAGEVINKLSNK
jgi:hypothetical protein